jgi:DNA-binding PadR family transcriptional regulator
MSPEPQPTPEGRADVPDPSRTKPLKPHWFQILLALADRDLHGLEIMDDVSERTDGAVHLWPGMLYGSLKRMLDEGLVVETEPPEDAQEKGGRPRYYHLTSLGRVRLAEEARRLASYVDVARDRNLLHGSDA